MSPDALLDVAHALMLDEARESDRGLLSAYSAHGWGNIDEILEALAADGSVAQFKRALDGATVMIDTAPASEVSADEQLAGITNLMDWAKQVNGR